MRRRSISMLAALFLSATSVGFGQDEPRARDAAGTVRLAGTVIDDSGSAVGRAIVRLTGAGLVRSRSAITDDDGRFAFGGLPAGQFTLTASRAAYITSSYGSKAPGRPGTPLRATAGQTIADLSITLARGAAIAGRITDQNGEPAVGVQVAVVRIKPVPAPLTFIRDEDRILTDDRGEYRAFGLEPGAYLVGAGVPFATNQVNVLSTTQIDAALQELQRRGSGPGVPPSRASDAGVPPSESFTLAQVLYPGTPNAAEARPVVVQAAEERAGVDFVLRPFRAATIEGVAVADNAPQPTIEINLAPAVPSPVPMYVGAEPTLAIRPTDDGKFRYTGVAPGTYVLTAQSVGRNFWGKVEVTTAGEDVAGISLTLGLAPHVRGHLVFEGRAPSGFDPASMRVRLTRPSDDVSPRALPAGVLNGPPPISPTRMTSQSTFDLSVMPGEYAITLGPALPSGFWLRSAMVGRTDVLDVPLDVTNDIPDVVLTLTDRHSELSGTLQTPAGSPATDYVVVIFTTDRALWRQTARRVVSTRPATDGHFAVRDLPAGDYYVAALTDLDPENWKTAEFLDLVVPLALRVSMADGQQLVQGLRIAR